MRGNAYQPGSSSSIMMQCTQRNLRPVCPNARAAITNKQYPIPAPSPRYTGEGPSFSDPYPHDAIFRWPAASPQASHLPRLDRCGRSSPRSVTSRLMLDFTGRWVLSSCFCAGPEGAASARGGVVPGSYAVIGGRLTGGPWSLPFFEPDVWESNEHKPGAGKEDADVPSRFLTVWICARFAQVC